MSLQDRVSATLRPARRLRAEQVLAAAFAVVPPACVLADKSTVLLLLLAAAAAGIPAWRDGWRPARPGAATGLAAIFFLWALAGSLWSFAPLESLGTWLRVAGVVLAAWLLAELGGYLAGAPAIRRSLLRALALGVALAAGVAVAELTLDHPLYRLATGTFTAEPVDASRSNRGVSLMVMAVWPALAYRPAAGASWRQAGLLALVAVAAAVSESGTAKVALAVALAFAGLGALHPRLRRALLAALVMLTVVLAPWIAQMPFDAGLHEAAWLAESSRHRVHIWNYAAQWALERPLIGWGFDSAARMPNFGVEPLIRDDVIPLHPHNAALQIWLSLGAVGVTLLVAALAAGLYRWETRARHAATLLAAAAAATITVASGGFGIWQTQWVASIGWLLVMAAVLAQPPAAAPGPDRRRPSRER